MLNIAKDLNTPQGLNKDYFYEAVVVDNNDSLDPNPDLRYLCRVRARIKTIFDGIPDSDLPWAIPMFDHGDGAGSSGGTQFVPKVGTKVLIKFQDGSANHPVYTGYPVDTKTKLQEMEENYPDRKVVRFQNNALAVLDTRTNELFLRNPGDLKIFILGNVELTIKGNVTEEVTGNRTSFVDGNVNEVVTGDKNTWVAGNLTHSVTGNVSTVVTGNESTSVVGTTQRLLGMDNYLSIIGNDSYQVSGSHVRNAARLDDNLGDPITLPPLPPLEVPDKPDLNPWTGIRGNASGQD